MAPLKGEQRQATLQQNMAAGPSTSQAHSEPLWFKGKAGNWERQQSCLACLSLRILPLEWGEERKKEK